ncbi:MAG: YdcF family protein [Salinivirgaceae bacterium]|nr:YdcF family protein [Salinivirgaceae bacterium]
MQKKYTWIAVIGFLLFVLFYFVTHAGTFLTQEASGGSADLVVVLMGDNDRLNHAAHLLKTQKSPSVLFVKPFVNAENIIDRSLNKGYFAIFKSAGIPDSSVIMIPEPAYNTTDELHQISKYIKERPQIKSIIIVSSQFHLRRVSLIAKTIFERNGVDVCYDFSYPENQQFDAKDWWKSSIGRKMVLSEYIKIVYFYTIDQFKSRN